MLKIKNLIVSWPVIIFFTLLGIILGLLLIFVINNYFKSRYAVFFLEDGYVYFGEVGFLRVYKLKNPLFLRQTEDGNLMVVYYSDLFYLPQKTLHLNPQKVIAWSYLQENSPLINYIQRKGLPLAPSMNQQFIPSTSTPNNPISTSTFDR